MNPFKKLFEIFKNKDVSDRKRNENSCTESRIAPKSYVPRQIQFYRLRRDGNKYYITIKIPYKADNTFADETVEAVFEFAYEMTFGGSGEHRNHRSGGTHARRNGEIFANTFQGKLAECAVCELFRQLGYDETPDFSRYGLGKWDSADLSIDGYEISIKSTKSFGNLLLLEVKDWDENGDYIPNIESGACHYDILLFVRLNPSSEDVLRGERLLYTDYADYDRLKRMIFEQEWSYQCVGFITGDDLRHIIQNRYILPQNALLNGKVKMDADNYYVQANDMRSIDELSELFKK